MKNVHYTIIRNGEKFDEFNATINERFAIANNACNSTMWNESIATVQINGVTVAVYRHGAPVGTIENLWNIAQAV